MATTTESTRSPDISYAGSTSLASSTTYYWRIKFWDASTTESVWSTATSTFILANIQYVQNWVYTKIGNIATSSALGDYVYGNTGYANPHAPLSIGGVTLTYDNNGNVLTYGSKAYTWDYRNRMTQAGTGVSTSTYAYDYAGNRVSEITGGITTKYASKLYSTNGATTTKYIYAGDTLIATVEKVGNATTTHIVHPDHLGGTNIITDASGNVVETLDYYPFGSIRTDTRTGSFDERKKYIGEQYDSATSLSYLNARYYDGGRGQFLSEDPTARDNPDQFLIDPQQLNSYNYGRNNPIGNKDPSGRCIEDACVLEMGLPLAITTAVGIISPYLFAYKNRWGTRFVAPQIPNPLGGTSTNGNDLKGPKNNATLLEKIAAIGIGTTVAIKTLNGPLEAMKDFISGQWNKKTDDNPSKTNSNSTYISNSTAQSSSANSNGFSLTDLISGYSFNQKESQYIQGQFNTYQAVYGTDAAIKHVQQTAQGVKSGKVLAW